MSGDEGDEAEPLLDDRLVLEEGADGEEAEACPEEPPPDGAEGALGADTPLAAAVGEKDNPVSSMPLAKAMDFRTCLRCIIVLRC
jgi:hypothetical protein